ncbi:hypothetical protein ANO14919_050280 [Xylariales sp. No.14919]|nr:hypothetical protein ANO14919_050280 [Xylariales sp. No.14919]
MDSAGLRSASKQASDDAQKRKAPDSQDIGDASPKRRKTKSSSSLTRAKPKKTVKSSVVADGDNTPESAGATLSTRTLALPAGTPPLSSNFRGALCDAVSYYKSHQGGIYSTGLVANGMLLNGKTTQRDVLQSQVIITTVGGGLAEDENGKRIRKQNQDVCTNYTVLNNAMLDKHPVAIVIGKKSVGKGQYANDLVDVQLPNHYNVVDFFYVTEIWTELQPTQRDGTRFAHYVVRLQKADLDSVSWWVPRGNERINTYAVGQFHCRPITCQSCNQPSKEIFEQGWCCLKNSCSEFFRFSSPNIDIDKLRYHQNFLNEREVLSGRAPPKFIPELPVISPGEYGSETAFKAGIVCPTCKWPSRRIFWWGWICEKGCGFKRPMLPLDVPLSKIRTEAANLMEKKARIVYVHSQIHRAQHTVNGYEVISFYLPNNPQNRHEAEFIGSVTILRPTQSTIKRKGGMDDLFLDLQQAVRVGDVELRRNPAFCRGSHMEELTSHFSCNMGADYKFGVVVETSRSFTNAPAPVLEALSRLTWGASTGVKLTGDHVSEKRLSIDSESMPNKFTDFNEQLILGYFEGSHIGYHDDGEKELGPTVATLSLGSPSIMHFRAKSKAGFGDAVNKNRVMLSFHLEHGDIVIMHGTKIHKTYEHSVIAGGVRRYALTCRYIRPETIPDAARREKALVNGAVPPEWQGRAYKGEATESQKY